METHPCGFLPTFGRRPHIETYAILSGTYPGGAPMGRVCMPAAVVLFLMVSGSFLLAQTQAPNPDTFYRLGPDSLEQEGVPKGEMRGPFTLPSAAYPGTQHTYWVYVPAQYDSAKPASLMIFQDGQAFIAPAGNLRAFNVLDNLIYR